MKTKTLPALALLPGLLLAPAASRAEYQLDAGILEGEDTLEAGLEIGGLLLDETATKFGHELFDVFKQAWRPPQGVFYNIVIGERYQPTNGSLVSVTLNGQAVFQGLLAPRRDAIEELGQGLARDIRQLLQNSAQLEDQEFY